jgi:hypothetical protein
MKFTVLTSVPYGDIQARLPAGLRGPLPPQTADAFNVIVFAADRVVHSGLAAKATRRLPASRELPTLAFAMTLTEEAQDILRTAEVFLVERKPWRWTDQSHEEIRVLTKAKVKGPDRR